MHRRRYTLGSPLYHENSLISKLKGNNNPVVPPATLKRTQKTEDGDFTSQLNSEQPHSASPQSRFATPENNSSQPF